ncbi:MAG: hypothetical protein ACI35R_13280 [Bacillus sp. (in: firmicutes)]
MISSQARTEMLLTTIDRLGMATIKHLRGMHDLKSYRNACFALKKLEPYTSTTFFNKEKVYYLNKNGRALIGSDKEVKKTSNMEHTLLRNDAFLYLNCPIDWRTEAVLEYEVQQPNSYGIIIKGVAVATKSKMIADAVYTRNGYTHIVEIDNIRDMRDNRKKLQSYVECFKYIDTPRLTIFTTTLDRKRKFEKWMLDLKIRGEALTFSDIV